MNSIAKARTNFIKIEDIEGLQESLAIFPEIIIEPHQDEPDYHMLYVDNHDGAWPSHGEIEHKTEGDDFYIEEVDFRFEEHVMPFVAEGEVLVLQEIIYEGLRYVSGGSSAYMREGNEIKEAHVNMEEIYEKAAQAFGVVQDAIAPCQYDLLSREVEIEQEQMKQNKAGAPRP